MRWLRNGFPLTFNPQVVSVRGIPTLTRASPPSLLTAYRDPVKNVALRDTVQQLLEKQCVRVMTETETGFFFKSVPRAQAVRRLAVSHRPIGTQRVPSAENVRDGHVGEGQDSSTSGHVGYLARSLRCVPPYTDKAIRSEVSMLSSGRSKVHVHGPTIWIDDSPVGVHGGSQADKKVDDPSPVRAISIHRRLVQRPPEQDGAAPQDGSAGAALSTARFTGKREEIGTSSLAVNRVLRRTSGSSGGQSVSDPRKSGRDPLHDPADPGGRRSTLPKRRISVGHAGSDIADGSVGAAESQTPSATSDSESKKGPSQYTADPGIGSVGATPEVVDVRGSPTDRIRFPSAISGAYDLHRRVDGRLGSPHSKANRGKESGSVRIGISIGWS